MILSDADRQLAYWVAASLLKGLSWMELKFLGYALNDRIAQEPSGLTRELLEVHRSAVEDEVREREPLSLRFTIERIIRFFGFDPIRAEEPRSHPYRRVHAYILYPAPGPVNRCDTCGYDMRELPADDGRRRCPECGRLHNLRIVLLD